MINQARLADYRVISHIASHVGSSFHIADPERLLENLEDFEEAFRAHWPRVSVAYSYKTNYLSAFIRAADQWGAWSEIVSEAEYDLARSLGIPARRIIVNGPSKSRGFLSQVLGVAARVQVDSIEELTEVAQLPGDEVFDVGIRCDLGEATAGTRFGIATWDSDLPEVLRAVSARLRVTSLHVHHSGTRTIDRFAERARGLARAHRDVFSEQPISMLDLGGGFGGQLPDQLANQIGHNPSFNSYAESMAREMLEVYRETNLELPDLVLEPGMAVLADTMCFVTQVVATKLDGGRSIAVVDGSFFSTMPLGSDIELPVQVVRRRSQKGETRNWRIVGATCMEVDVLRRELTAALEPGDYLVFYNVGAYSTSLTPAFIRDVPPIVDMRELPDVRILAEAVPLVSRHGASD